MKTLEGKFSFMKSTIMRQQEISETKFILILDKNGLGQATYNKIKKDFRINALEVGIHFDKKEKIYRVGSKTNSLTTLPLKEQKDLK